MDRGSKTMIERTFVFVKPDGVERGVVGKILTRFEDAGLKLVAMKQIWIDKDFSKKHYAEHKDKPFYLPLEEYVVSGPIIAMVLEGVQSVELVRKMVGPTEPSSAPPGTIRGDFAHTTFSYSDTKGIAIKNLIHASATSEESKQEIVLWFTPEEIHSYNRTDERHIL